jgi:NAD(P)-dependent dehydrogenase (short-subunit alcohol dehydrogenase family)
MPSKFLNKLQGHRVVIFGSTSGIGFAVAEGAIEYGAIVLVSSSSTDKVARALERLRTSYPEEPTASVAISAIWQTKQPSKPISKPYSTKPPPTVRTS